MFGETIEDNCSTMFGATIVDNRSTIWGNNWGQSFYTRKRLGTIVLDSETIGAIVLHLETVGDNWGQLGTIVLHFTWILLR